MTAHAKDDSTGAVLERTVLSSAALHAAVAEAVAAAKAADPMAPVTLVVDSPLAGTQMRRQLVASGALGPGVAGVRLVTPSALMDELSAAAGLPSPAHVSHIACEAVVSARLHSDPGPFAASADHPSTVLRLAGALDELRWVDLDLSTTTPSPDAQTTVAPDSLVAAGETTQAVVTFIEGARSDLDSLLGQVPDVTLARQLTAVLDDGIDPRRIARLGAIVITAQRVPAPVHDVLEALAPLVPSITRIRLEPHHELGADHLSCPDPSTEAAYAARSVVGLLDDGARPDEIAVLYGSDVPYAALLAGELDAAGVAWHGPTATTLGATAFARAVDVLLAMAEGVRTDATGITRPLLLRWFSLGPVPAVDGEGYASTARWRGLIRDQGWYGDAGQWRSALAHLAAAASELLADAEADDSTPEGDDGVQDLDRHARVARTRAVEASSLDRFLDAVATDLMTVAGATSWSEMAQALATLIARWIPSSGASAAEVTERQARQRVLAMLEDELPELDALRGRAASAPAAEVPALRGLLARDLGSRRGRHGDIGAGVQVGPVRGAGLLHFRHLVIVGAAEGALPPIVKEDPLLPDAVRMALRRAPDDLVASVEHAVEVERDLRAITAGADSVVVTWPRAALPGRGAAHASRFLPSVTSEAQHSITSRWSSLGDQPWPVTPVDLGVHDLLQRDPDDVPPELAVTVAAARSASISHFDRYHGDLSEVVDELVWDITASPLSASAIEGFLHCPYHFFVQRVLRFSTDTIEDEVDEIAPKDLGTLLHKALEEFVLTAIDDGWLPAPGDAWRPDAETILRGHLDTQILDAEQRGLTGWRPAWDARKEALVATLGDFLAADASEVRGAPATTPIRAEIQFGGADGEVDVPFILDEERVVHLRGAIDRLDVSDDRGVVGVVDYKSGKSSGFRKKLGDADGKGREKVQDLVYDVAARALVPEADEVAVRFVFVPNEGTVKVESATHVSDREAMLREILTRLADAGRDGQFVAAPGAYRDWCPVCTQMGRRARAVARSAGMSAAADESGFDSELGEES